MMTAILKFQMAQRRLQEQAADERDRRAADWYPLGNPGRLRSLLRDVNQMVPRVLVCGPVDAAIGDILSPVEALLREFDDSGRFCYLVTDVLIDEQRRPIRGETIAREVAVAEFDPAPSVIIHTERVGALLQVSAQLSHVFNSLDGQTSMPFPLARISGDTVEAAWAVDEGDILKHRWSPVQPDAEARDDLVGAVVASMAIGLLRVYWGTQGVNWRFSDISENPYEGLLDVELSRHRSASLANESADRLFQEIAILESEFGQVTASQGDDELLVLWVTGQPEVFFELSLRYPTEPPDVWVRDGGRFVVVKLDPSDWTPDRCLAEVVRGIRHE